VDHARLRLACLWVSQTSRVLADWCLGMAVFAALVDDGKRSAWYLTAAVFIAPRVILAPLNGYLGNGLPRRRMLVASAAFTLLAVVVCRVTPLPWLICLGAVAVGSAVYSSVRYAVLPAAALDSGVPLPRVSGWMEMGSAVAIVLGALAGVEVVNAPPAVMTSLFAGLNLLCLIAAFRVAFPSDVIRPEPVRRAATGFFSDWRRILRDREARVSLFALAGFQAVFAAGSGTLLTLVLGAADFVLANLLRALLLVGVGAAAGCAAASIQGHPRRCLGLVPFGATGLLLALAWAGLAGGTPPVPYFLLGFMGGLVNVPLRATYLAAVPADARGNATAAMNAAIYLAVVGLSLAMYGLVETGLLPTPAFQLTAVATLVGAGAVLAWVLLYAQAMETTVEVGLLPIYHIRAHGPGARGLPSRGPLLIIANHSAYLDPFWIAKVVPRQVRPMMTSAFYDLPVVRWLSRHVARAIRVPYGSFRREAPELDEAIAALCAGDCIVIFPEGRLRRSETELLMPFGRGVWNILSALPDTAVAFCWIEGGWGSYYSHKNGPPGKNKQADRGRPIDIAFSEPRPIEPAVLADHHTARQQFRRRLAECRAYLGLPVPPLYDRTVESAEEPASEPQSGN
jgi:1-acyl-sn-glycerol-3-phosphate acyltransferase